MLTELTDKERGYVEGYAKALTDVQYDITGDTFNSKSYDPMKVDDIYLHSYAFNLKDGGRHHPIKDYESVEEICKLMLDEILKDINEVYTRY